MPIAPPNGSTASVPLALTDVHPQPSTRPTEVPKSSDQNTQSATAHQHGEAANAPQDEDGELRSAVDTLNRSMQAWSTHLRFEIDEDSTDLTVHVVDSETGEVIKSIPAESVIEAAAEVSRQLLNNNDRLDSKA
jgi:flagellar protein FlaG